MKSMEEIFDIIKINKPELIKQYSIKDIGIFGSYVRNEQRLDSDVDILVDFKKPISLFEFLELEENISNLIGERVDLVSRKALKPHIGEIILKEVVEL